MTRPGKAQQQQQKQRAERSELLDQAARHMRENALAKALPLYQQLYDFDPKDWAVANALGDLYGRMNNVEDAIAVFMDLAEHMVDQGHAVKARALYRKVLRMRPGDAAATARVGELENVNLDASPFMQRVRGALLDAQAAGPPPPPPAYALEPPIPVSPSPFETPVEAALPDEPLDTGSDDWIPLGLSLAAAPLEDRPTTGINPVRLGAFQRMEDVARRAAAHGDFQSAAEHIEQFLRAHPEDVEALQMLVDVSVDGRLGGVDTTQIRLADACLATGRASTGRHVALDLLNRQPATATVEDLIDRILATAGVDRPAAEIDAEDSEACGLADAVVVAPPVRSAPVPLAPVPLSAVSPAAVPVGEFDGDELDLFDDDGLVTDEGRRRTPLPAPAPSRPADPLDDWLDASDETDAENAVANASRLTAAGDLAGAMATLEPMMRTPALRPFVGVHLAQLYRRTGDLTRALHCLELTAEQPPVHEDNAHALAYELALTLESMGQRSEALGLYRELLSAVGPAFRDVAARAEHLSAA